MSKLSVGVIGLGSMGFGMATNSLKAGFSVKGFDISEKTCRAFETAGGTAAANLADVASDVDVLLVMVVNADQANAVLFGEGGAAEAARPGTVVMMCCTIAPKDMRQIAGDLSSYDLKVLDSPVSGGKVGADGGSLTIMAAGSREAFETARPVLDAIACELYEVGDTPGLGATYKIVHQLAAGVHLAVAAEVMAFGAHAGCDSDILFDILSHSAGQSWMMKDRVPHMLVGNYAPQSTVDIFVKDLGLVIDTGYATKTPLPLASAALQLFMAASSMGHGRVDDSAVVKVYEAMTGSTVRTGG